MLQGSVPFKGNNMQELQKLITSAEYSFKEEISAEAQDLIQKLLSLDPTQRPSITNILMHPWLKNTSSRMQVFNDQEREQNRKEYIFKEVGPTSPNESREEITKDFTEQNLNST